MTESGKIVVATALSVLAHVTLFTGLALMPSRALVQNPEPPPQDERPLEVTLETVAAVPSPTPAAIAVAPEEPPLSSVPSQAIRTQIDPENLKKVDEAPEHATAIAAHHSRATAAKAPTPEPKPADPGALTLQASRPTPTPEEMGIDALGNYGKAVGNAIGVRSEAFRKSWKEPLAVGEVRVQFVLEAGGRVSEVQILSNTAGPANAACAERAVKEAKIPPIPADRLAQVPGGRIRIVYSFIIYPSP